MNLVYDIKDRPSAGRTVVFAFQQLLAILAATIAVPSIVGNGMSQSAALFGAGIGTLVYLLFTKFRSPVFLGSSFAFLPSMFVAFGGAVSASAGYAGLLIGAAFAGLVYVIIAILVKAIGVRWIAKLMPPVVIGPTVAIIGLSLAGNAVGDALNSGANYSADAGAFVMGANAWACLVCAMITFFFVILCSVYGGKGIKLIPFIIGIGVGYVAASSFTLFGTMTGNEALILVDFSKFANMQWVPDFAFLKAAEGFAAIDGKYIATIAVAYIPVAFVVFAEHLADHRNLSTIIGRDLLVDPGLHSTLLGDGVGSVAGAVFGGCPNTTYGESIACVAITSNASVVTIVVTAVIAIGISFIGPFITFLSTIPGCVMGGVCITLYGFIAVSGLKMIQNVNLSNNRNLFVVSSILITGIGGMILKIGEVTLTEVACALIIGIVVNLVLGTGKSGKKKTAKK